MSTLAGIFFAFNILYLSEIGLNIKQIILIMLVQAGFGLFCCYSKEDKNC